MLRLADYYDEEVRRDLQALASLIEPLALILMADSFPPPVLSSHGLVAWVPTIEMSVNIRSLPKTPWVKACFRSRYITCGLVEEDGELWDEDGNILAISRQIAQFRKLS